MSERGIALAGAILTLAVVGVIVSAVFLLGVQDQRTGISLVRQQQAFTAAERAVEEAARAGGFAGLAVGASRTAAGWSRDVPGWHRVTITRLSDRYFLVQGEGFSADTGARQLVGRLLVAAPAPFPTSAALQTGGPVVPASGTEVSGTDHAPPLWPGCATPTGNVPGVAPLVDSAGYLEPLKERITRLLPGGAFRIEPTAARQECDTAAPTNWGEPLSPSALCGSYFPVVWIDGDLTLTGGRGQGVLVVLGDLVLSGGVEFYGAVWVQGTLRTQGAGGRITGTVVASSAELDPDPILNRPVIVFSSCVVTRALAFAAYPDPIRHRGWVELF